MEVSGAGRDNIRPTLTSFFSLTRNRLDQGESDVWWPAGIDLMGGLDRWDKNEFVLCISSSMVDLGSCNFGCKSFETRTDRNGGENRGGVFFMASIFSPTINCPRKIKTFGEPAVLVLFCN